ncbi:MAG: transposase [Limnoraphis robusta]|uniref:Transposase n=1 Tax=Limnoraphis robusta CS-951 TaxID=1637645 RepID=A0A0J9EUU6_9CYAN|nr:transposase [Limnoraphis robusta]KMW69836.1 transposase [Limnoraphis robusta CS-951]MEA5495927.1 transposase [Limnoraphis robusta BA-68 BA1]
MRYRRAKINGGTYFFTVVTYQRRKILCEPDNIALLREAFRYVMGNHPFTIDAIVILPDHLHCIWTLPENDCDFSTRWRLIKSEFSRRCDSKYKQKYSLSRQRKNEQAIWQRRFWEHCIRDDKDLIQHVDYIHYNPVKHGLVKSPKDWQYSSFHRFVKNGLLTLNWGENEEIYFIEGIGFE